MTSLIEQLPPVGTITAARELQLLTEGGESNLNEVCLGFMREAFAYAKTCAKSRLEEGEIFSLCYEGLMQAASASHRSKRVNKSRFFIYAKFFLRGQISRKWKLKDVVRNAESHESLDVPHACHSKLNHDFWLDNGHAPAYYEAIEDVCVNRSQIPLDDSTATFQSIDLREKWSVIGPVLTKCLNEHEMMILFLRYRCGFTFAEIGDRLAVSRQAVEKTHSSAMKKMRSALFDSGDLSKL